ncbi:putative UDP-glucose epimerase YtcB [Dokdonia pacifica]|uniref:NAD-dependent epimerase/dehydratase family protein n=1 Tax=Dokdonia pacifica TaxID=1627892 RepID=UPI000B78E865|nr:NAD-dependent epimerase/dehydratase family protein [Dokdonia pacifica]GGG20010.1 putative UDP-glucose epimerase YtcB [Dokdonia pacifica]
MKVLITGVAGFIGSHLAERLKKMDFEVVGVDNFNSYYSPMLKRKNASLLDTQGIQIIECDLRTSNLVMSLPVDIDYIFHCAAQPGIASTCSFKDYMENNIIATEHLIDFARQFTSLKMFVNIGTSSIYGRNVSCDETQAVLPISNYGVTKLAAEQLVLASSRSQQFKACSLRLYSVYGSRERPDKLFTKLIDCGLHNKKFPLFKGSLNHKRSFTHVSDIVNGIVSVIGKEDLCTNQIINLGIDKEYTTQEGIEIVEDLLKTKISFQDLPSRAGDQQRTIAIIDKARSILKYNPRTKLREGVYEQIEWFKNDIKFSK